MKFSALVIFSLICGGLGSPLDSKALVDRNGRELDLLASTRDLVNELITNMNEAITRARDGIEKFRDGLQQQATAFQNRVTTHFENLQVSVTEFADRVSNTTNKLGNDVNICIEENIHKSQAFFSKSVDELLTCGRNLFEDVGDKITSLLRLTDNASSFTSKTLDELRDCYKTTQSTDIIGLGRCVGSLAVQAELEATGFFAQSAYLIGRINLSFITMPAGLQACAGTQLLEAGRHTADTFRDLLSCSGTVVSNIFTPVTNINATPTKV